MPKTKLPAGPTELTAKWLSHAVGAPVRSFSNQVIGEGVGLLGQLARVNLEYEGRAEGAPRSLIAKFPAAVQENRDLANLFQFYEREVRFYEDIARRAQMATPHCFFSAFDAATGTFVLLMEDLSEARIGDQCAGATQEEAELAVREMAKFHADWWGKVETEELDWIPHANAPVHRSAEDSYQKSLGPCLNIFGHRVPDSVRPVMEKLATNVCYLLDRASEPPCTIVHGDFRYDNLFFAEEPGKRMLAVIDWQIMSRARGPYDLGYFLSQSVQTDARRAREKDLLAQYYQTLLDNGVKDYSREDCFQDYRRSVLYCLVYPVIAGGTLDLSNERGVSLVSAMLERSLMAIDDLNCGELLPG